MTALEAEAGVDKALAVVEAGDSDCVCGGCLMAEDDAWS